MLLLKRWLVGRAVVQVDGVHRRTLHGGQAHLVGQVRHPLLRGQDPRPLAPHLRSIGRWSSGGGGNSRFPATSRGAPPTPGFPSKLVGGNSKLPYKSFPFRLLWPTGIREMLQCYNFLWMWVPAAPGSGLSFFPVGKRRRPKEGSERHSLRCGGEGKDGGGSSRSWQDGRTATHIGAGMPKWPLI